MNRDHIMAALTPAIAEAFAFTLAEYLEAGGTVMPGTDRDRLFHFFQRGYIHGFVGADPDSPEVSADRASAPVREWWTAFSPPAAPVGCEVRPDGWTNHLYQAGADRCQCGVSGAPNFVASTPPSPGPSPSVGSLARYIEARVKHLDNYDPRVDGYNYDMEAEAAQKELRLMLAMLPTPPSPGPTPSIGAGCESGWPDEPRAAELMQPGPTPEGREAERAAIEAEVGEPVVHADEIDRWMAVAREAKQQILREIRDDCALEFSDPRLSYVTVQIGVETWERLNSALTGPPGAA